MILTTWTLTQIYTLTYAKTALLVIMLYSLYPWNHVYQLFLNLWSLYKIYENATVPQLILTSCLCSFLCHLGVSYGPLATCSLREVGRGEIITDFSLAQLQQRFDVSLGSPNHFFLVLLFVIRALCSADKDRRFFLIGKINLNHNL